ncbi:MAG: hypothetical protein M1503_09260 [Thaumarchaeota archaeon]|nr:hypothetical protein [Nitrososphaerota archaeon]MCL5318425.1 hypothetical protein [Nitrososphaerota archaeon]
MDNGWSLEGPDAELIDNTDVPEQVLQAPLNLEINEKNIDTVKERVVKHFSAIKVGFLTMGAPRPEDVKIMRKDLRYIPYWRIYGTYAFRYVRKTQYNVNVQEDVEEVKIHGKVQQIRGQRKRLSDIISEVGASGGLGFGPAKIPLAPLQGVMKAGLQKALGSRDMEFGRKAELTIAEAEELAADANHLRTCFNASIGGQDKKMFEAIEKVSAFNPVSKDVAKKSAAITFTKEHVIGEVKKTLIQDPDISPCRLIEREVSTNKLELIYVPYYEIVAEAKGQQKTIKINALTGEDYTI